MTKPGERFIHSRQNPLSLENAPFLVNPPQPIQSAKQHASLVEQRHETSLGFGQRAALFIGVQPVSPSNLVVLGKTSEQPGHITANRLAAHRSEIDDPAYFLALKQNVGVPDVADAWLQDYGKLGNLFDLVGQTGCSTIGNVDQRLRPIGKFRPVSPRNRVPPCNCGGKLASTAGSPLPQHAKSVLQSGRRGGCLAQVSGQRGVSGQGDLSGQGSGRPVEAADCLER